MMNKEKEVVSMHNVINDYWNHYNEMKSKDELREKKARIIAENSVPIIWHGRLVDYYKSQVRIITVSQIHIIEHSGINLTLIWKRLEVFQIIKNLIKNR